MFWTDFWKFVKKWLKCSICKGLKDFWKKFVEKNILKIFLDLFWFGVLIWYLRLIAADGSMCACSLDVQVFRVWGCEGVRVCSVLVYGCMFEYVQLLLLVCSFTLVLCICSPAHLFVCLSVDWCIQVYALNIMCILHSCFYLSAYVYLFWCVCLFSSASWCA